MEHEHQYRLTTEQYYRMGEAGIFGDDKRIELIDGQLIRLLRITPNQARVGGCLFQWMMTELWPEFCPGHRHPITISNGTEPVPDLYVARGPIELYEDRHPCASDLLLIVEVSDAPIATDRKRKLGLYASSGIPEFWIVNLVDKQLEIYRKPAQDAYSETVVLKPGDAVPLSFAPGKSIAVSDFLR